MVNLDLPSNGWATSISSIASAASWKVLNGVIFGLNICEAHMDSQQKKVLNIEGRHTSSVSDTMNSTSIGKSALHNT